MHGLKLAFLFLLATGAATAAPIVTCTGTDVDVRVDQASVDVYYVHMKFPSGTVFTFQGNGVIRSDRGFAAWGTRGFVYSRQESGRLDGWVALGSSIWKDLTCKYLF